MTSLDPYIIKRCKEFYKSIGDEKPSVFNKGWWTTKIMDWCMTNEDFKIQLFRFVDVLPYLNTSESLSRHIKEYFDVGSTPPIMRWASQNSLLANKLTGALVGATIRTNLERMAKQFIIGENIKDSLKNIKKIRKNGFALTIDILGEACVSEAEADEFLEKYLELLSSLKESFQNWHPVGGDTLDWGYAPRINISVKPSALFSQTNPVDFEGSVAGIEKRLKKILRAVRELGGSLCIDMEHHQFKDITIELYKRLRSSHEFADYPHLGLALQSYLKETDHDLEDLLTWAREKSLPISIRLVKGAYWDYETIVAKQNGWEIPVYGKKPESDIAFERHIRLILKNHDICYLACGSHNIRSIATTMETASELNVPANRYEFQVLYGMAEPVRKGLQNIAKRVRLYAPYGDLLPGMAYLVRRLLENTANESFLRQSFVEGTHFDLLVENPIETLSHLTAQEITAEADIINPTSNKRTPFINEPFSDFSSAAIRENFREALELVREKLGKTIPLHIGGKDIETDDRLSSVNPALPDEIIGTVSQAGIEHVDLAFTAASKAFTEWSQKIFSERAKVLFKAAKIARQESYILSAWQVLEVGKQWGQAQADVAEAIDFLEYYGREAIKMDAPQRQGNCAGEINLMSYQPKGVAAVIAPWNFPLAISCGMAAAAIVTGNTVIYKPAGPSSVVGNTLLKIFQQAGLPDGVFNYLPGRGSIIGDYLIEHPALSLIAFTGSMEVGHRIINKASQIQQGQTQIKKVIAELGGKNAIIIDDDADLDEAVRQVISSAFAFQGQKCSACSRVIVLDSIYDKFKTRLIEATQSITIGPAENPAFFLGPVVDKNAQENILKYIELAKEEGTLLHCPEVPHQGFYVPPTIVEGITPQHRIAQEEIFGPVLALMRAKNITEALDWANDTKFGLTGAIFSRSPQHLELARKNFNVGNLYLNRGSTGALVDRHPFGGFKMSGIGSKAGGPDYLRQFVDPKVVSENTMRRGFAPDEKGDC